MTEVFDKLVAFPSLLSHPNLTLEVLLLRENHVRAGRPLAARRWTRDPGERRLIDVLDRVEIRGPADVVKLLPILPSEPFSTRELASLLNCNMLLAQRTAYCLRMLNIPKPPVSAAAHRCTDEGSSRRFQPDRRPVCRALGRVLPGATVNRRTDRNLGAMTGVRRAASAELVRLRRVGFPESPCH